MQTAPNFRAGVFFVCCSIVLVSAAQLLLKDAMTNSGGLHGLKIISTQLPANIVLPFIGGLMCYAISVVIWQCVLGELPLSVAYPLLSISYPLVYLAALLLPGYTETINPQRIGGLAFTFIGIVLLSPRSNHAPVTPIDNNDAQ